MYKKLSNNLQKTKEKRAIILWSIYSMYSQQMQLKF